jgi:hypothetical protein
MLVWPPASPARFSLLLSNAWNGNMDTTEISPIDQADNPDSIPLGFDLTIAAGLMRHLADYRWCCGGTVP